MRLLADPHPDLVRALVELPTHLQAIFPQKERHRRQLPRAVAELSALLTTERDDLPPDYMNRPALLSAYLHHFLPWNLLRLGRLFRGLGSLLDPGVDGRVLDLGSGPLTAAAALWQTRPDLRRRALEFTAVDRSDAALKVGVALLERLSVAAPWRVRTVRHHGSGGPRVPGEADLLIAANVLNEMAQGAGRPGRRQVGGDGHDALRPLKAWIRALRPGGRLLLVEPGTRQASRLLVGVRAAALDRGWRILAPCPHAGTCPQPGTGRSAWCHLTGDTTGVPDWLLDLDHAAGLPKARLSLSFMLLEMPGGADKWPQENLAGAGLPAAPAAALPALVVSDPLPMAAGRRVYACSGRGLLLVDGQDLPSWRQGDGIEVIPENPPRKDAKSGALLASTPGKKGRNPRRPRRR